MVADPAPTNEERLGPATSLTRLLDARTVAIAGMSADPGKHGRRVLANLRRFGYRGQIWGVNPKLPAIDDIDVYARVRDLPTTPDLVVAAVPSSAVARVVADCAGVGAVIVFASGFGEAGPAGRALEEELVAIAAASGIRLLGPNSGGLIVPGGGLTASFLTCLDRPPHQIVPGPVAVVTQSGGTGSYLHNLAANRGEGLALSISTGNEADIRLGEAIEAVAGLPDVEVILAVVETIRDGRRFIEAVRSARSAGKSVVVSPLGSGPRSRSLMASHTGALALGESLARGVYESLGVVMAETPGEAYEMAVLMARCRRPRGPRVGVVTHSGGMAILVSDLAERHHLALPPPSAVLESQVADSLDHGSAANPLDLGGIIGGPARFAEVVERFAGSGEYDLVLSVSTAHPPGHTQARAQSLLSIEGGVPIVHLWMAGDQGEVGLRILRESGAPVTEEPRVAVRAVSGLTAKVEIKPLPHAIAGRPDGWPIPRIDGLLAGTASEAVAVAEEIGYPVVLKLESSIVTHKTDAGAVFMDLREPGRVAEAHDRAMAVAAGAGDNQARSRVQRQRKGLEMIVGGLRHDSFGPLVSIGFGGILTEVIGDVTFAPAPVDEERAAAMIDSLRGRPLLDGVRGSPPVDVDELARIVSVVSRGMAGSDITGFEINPLMWEETEWVALDWLVEEAK